MAIDNIKDLSSDHSPLLLTLSSAIIRKQVHPKLTTKSTDWNAYREKIHQLVDLRIRLKTAHELELAVDKFTSDLTTAAQESTPTTIHNHTELPTYPQAICILVKERRKARH